MKGEKSPAARVDLAKVVFYLTLAVVVVVVSFGYGTYSSMVKNLPYQWTKALCVDVKNVWYDARIYLTDHPDHYLFPARNNGSGLTVNKMLEQGELIFLSGFFGKQHEIRLLRRDGTIVKRWVVKFSEIFPDTSGLARPANSDWNTDLDGALALPDGSVVFNLENGGMVKLDKCGKTLWTLQQAAHHSVGRAEAGGFWVPGRTYYAAGQPSPTPPFSTPLAEDLILRVSEGGKLLEKVSVPRLLYANGLESLLTSSGESITANTPWDEELVHLNKIDELKSTIAADFPGFSAGDLLLSLRQYNLLFVVDPRTWTVKWLKIGPWLRQHDPEFMPGGKILVFNNNCYRKAYDDHPSPLAMPRVSNILEYDPGTDEAKKFYGQQPGQELLTVIRGTTEYLPSGHVFTTEYEGGRALETNSTGEVVWEYVNRYDEDEVAGITDGHVYPADYFAGVDWSCSQ